LFCINCGSPVEKRHRFCKACGSALLTTHSENAAPVATVELTPAIRDIRQFRACSAIPFIGAVVPFAISPISLFAGTQHWLTFGLTVGEGTALCILGTFVARGSVWAAMTLTGAIFLAGLSALWGLTQDPAISNGAGAVAVIEFCALLCWPTAKGYERHYVIASFAWQWANGP